MTSAISEDPVFAESSALEGLREIRIEERLFAEFIPAGGGAGPIAVLSHGLFSDSQGHKTTALFNRLAAEGLDVLRFDYSGCGRSEGDFEDTTYSRRRADLDTVFRFVLDERGLGAHTSLRLYGSSMGGAVSLLCAAREPRIDAVALLAPVAHTGLSVQRHPEHWAAMQRHGFIEEDGRRLTMKYVDDASEHDVVSSTRILRCPVLAVHGTDDEVVPPSDAHDIAVAARRASLYLVEGADHRFSWEPHWDEALERIAEFMLSAKFESDR